MEMSTNQQKDISMFVLVSFDSGPYHGALYEVKLEHGESSEASPPVLVPVIKFFDKCLDLPKDCLFEGVRFGSCSKLHVLANGQAYPCKPITTTNSFVFDTDTTSVSDFQHFAQPKKSKPYGIAISAYGMLYYFANRSCSQPFERYVPATNSWESLPSCPYKPKPRMTVAGYAVCYGYILISMYNSRDCGVMAFHIDTQKWLQVKVTDSRHYPFVGRAVVVDGTIYSLSLIPDEILAFSFWRDSDDTCYLGAALPLHLWNIAHPPSPMMEDITQNLVHLGGLDFCLVHTGQNESSLENQYLCITTLRILREGGGTEIRTLRSSVYQVDLMGSFSLEVNFSFTPDCEDVEPEEDCCPTAPVKSEVGSTRMTLEDKENKADPKLYVAAGREQVFLSIPTKVAILS
ncbi:PREDICTED: uncharacterized protein LOC101315376 [Fragaria vesca subsp. vesca]|uniref:uncharacterized protein LOC101315376 n=1 Tax=Fragaria vesca subsp. vesca TaxID=101020 RepID=UPI0002C330EF|nr:PREDICTED: uncharacterized protein LOC101315376 [Fragaria vesca subsp. vesca]XP_011469058.1 PREDICTED: uncharacterized protein LOC101315376 [Fragaria vesca subsp. vesca]